MLDIDFVRAQFPAFSEPSLKGRAFFENAGGSYPCRQVTERLDRFYRSRKVQPYYGFEASKLGGEEMDEARSGLSAMLGVDASELSFGPSTTQNTYVLSQAFRQMLEVGDAIIVTNQDHEANSGPWRRLADAGIEIREWCVDPDSGSLEIEALEQLLDQRVKLVCFPHCSNIVAEINPVQTITQLIREAGAVSCVDGVSYAPHGLPNVCDLGADIYLFSTYKTYGPHQGVMVVREPLAQRLPNQGHYFNGGDLTKKFTPAGPDHAQIAACAGISDYLNSIAAHHGCDAQSPHAKAQFVHDLFRAHERELLQPLLDYVMSKDKLRLLGPCDAEHRAPTVAVALSVPGQQAAAELALHGIMAGDGDFYGGRIIEAMGERPEHGLLRLSFVHYTSENEITQLLRALDAVL
ncbi:aminotransferase class V-fold PLP-dependent enzyme [Halieaceae bacterium IMCC8485]|uniref:Aminotransferase class V-fold PLP-dependent enzyme n=1 Tax=Candidatus Seongchinamella marina TaxID=2518990 RepID=A0ABT3SW64_9GAMM|nr:aminotransferase class V-fold PLP-dependent enzyme [Candidatus Seongchinamella marina]MCX2974229.1 aminotransferase class V-fold PLP-dependent enzyme [Candidatus Seongchinamella marina]